MWFIFTYARSILFMYYLIFSLSSLSFFILLLALSTYLSILSISDYFFFLRSLSVCLSLSLSLSLSRQFYLSLFSAAPVTKSVRA